MLLAKDSSAQREIRNKCFGVSGMVRMMKILSELRRAAHQDSA